jgi:hypothetical protein
MSSQHCPLQRVARLQNCRFLFNALQGKAQLGVAVADRHSRYEYIEKHHLTGTAGT